MCATATALSRLVSPGSPPLGNTCRQASGRAGKEPPRHDAGGLMTPISITPESVAIDQATRWRESQSRHTSDRAFANRVRRSR
jgi:hypothetical protein